VENLKCLIAHRSDMQPLGTLDVSRSSAAGDVDPVSVARGAAFALAAGAVAAALLGTVGETTGVAGRFTLLALLALPSASFVFAALEQDSTPRLAGALDPTPGVVEAWGVALLTAAGGTVVYGPALGLGPGPVNASLVLLALFSYLVGPPWLAWRLLDGTPAADVAVVTVLLSVLSVLAGGALLAFGAAGALGGIPMLGAAGVLGVLVVGYWAASPSADEDSGTDHDEIDSPDRDSDTDHDEIDSPDRDSDTDADDQDETHHEIDAAAARRSNRTG
jgi:hypothetical protein